MNSGQDVSVVVQGPVLGLPSDPEYRQHTRRALISARAAWPECELILSTWKGSDTAGLAFDHLVVSDDPGAIPFNDGDLKHRLNNLNRQVASTQAGLAHATRRFAVKLRSDCALIRPVDFSLLDAGPINESTRLLERRVIALTLYTRHPLRRPVLCHLSDLFHAGLLVDLRKLWSAPLVEEPAFTRAVDPLHRPVITPYPEHDFLMRCAAEQYIIEQLIRRRYPRFCLRSQADGGIRALFIWLRVLASNFTLLTPSDAGVSVPPHIAGHETDWDLFQPSDKPWLEIWAHDHVPIAVRLRTAIDYWESRLAFSPPNPFRARCRGALRLLRSAFASLVQRSSSQAH